MRTIHKFPLRLQDEQDVSMPFGAEIIAVAFQRDTLCLWAEVESTNSPNNRRIHIIGTGNKFPDGVGFPNGSMRHIGTVQQMSGHLIWHVYEQL